MSSRFPLRFDAYDGSAVLHKIREQVLTETSSIFYPTIYGRSLVIKSTEKTGLFKGNMDV
ncbi:hypothetical protein N7481_006214 [Penicillium waksmanii]|uniref:uncharacterized protein n=1 Tax=Penicillium waksmanii TaxID=69791 RepID=UPI002547B60F|nr:uncharacterized protein N7481_006214 [Penicillium waksmanii]KAJ5984115.1 hypothetical protein N7481_006214 [Penicillium waksmanii]